MVYLGLTLISLVIKIFVYTKFKQIYNATTHHLLIMLFITILVVQSTFELALYYFAYQPNELGALLSLKGYYLCLFGIILCLPYLAIKISGKNIKEYYGVLGIVVYAGFFALIALTDWIIAGTMVEASTQSITKIAGQYYWLFQVSALLSVLFIISTLISQFKNKDFIIRTRCINLAIAFIPVFVFSFLIIFIMALGVKLNAVGVLPFCFVIYAAALAHNANAQKQPDYLVFIPYSKKNKILFNTLHDLLYANKNVNKKTDEKELIEYYLSQPGLTQRDVAKILNMSEATLSRRKKSHTIE